jgi:BCD family chlorophyll transporter-like MFS transporter
VGGLLGAAASDVARTVMESQSLAYASVFSIESGLFIASAYLASKVEK